MRLIDADAYLESIKPRGISDELWKECKEYKSVISFLSAQPEKKTGYIEIRVISMIDGEDCYCSECGANSLLPSDKFCRKCGVEFIGVRGEQDG